MQRRMLLLRAATGAACALLVAGCGSPPIAGASGPTIAAPTAHVGDRWVYHATEGYRDKIEWEEVHEIARVAPDGIAVEVTLKGDGIDYARTELWSQPGTVREGAIYEAETRKLDPPLIRYKYPMSTGDRWSQQVRDLNQEPGRMARSSRASPWAATKA